MRFHNSDCSATAQSSSRSLVGPLVIIFLIVYQIVAILDAIG